MNHVFILAHKHTKASNGFDDYNHAFGMTATLIDDEIQAVSGLDFGGSYGFDPKGAIIEKMTTEAIFLPITEDSFNRFNNLMNDLSVLHEAQRSPYYFRRTGKLNLYMESYQNFTHIDGYLHDPRSVKQGVWDRNLTDAYGEMYDLEKYEYLTHDDIVYVHGNCVDFINFAAKQSGIDLKQLAHNWWAVGNGAEMSEAIKGAFNQGRFKVPGAQDFCFQTYKTPSGQTAWKVEHDTKEGVRMSDLIDITAASKGGAKQLFDFFQSQKPFECAPAPVPEYLQARLDELKERPDRTLSL